MTEQTPRRAAAFATTLPGLIACIVGGVIAWGIAQGVGAFIPGFSPMLAAIIVGVIATNLRRLPLTWENGIAFSAKRLLRTGVVLLGFSLGISDIIGLGWQVIVLAVVIVGAGTAAGYWLGVRLGLTPEQSLLTSGGCSICGAAAVAGIDGTLRNARSHETATAVANVVVYGTLMIAVGPLVARFLPTEKAAGVFIGGATHEVAQVVAAGGIAGAGILTVAVVVKLARVLLLAPLLLVIGLLQRRAADSPKGTDGSQPGSCTARNAGEETAAATDADGTTAAATNADSAATADGASASAAPAKRPPLVPLFVVGFIAAVIVRSTGILPGNVVHILDQIKTWLFIIAMVALGTGVHRDTLRAAGVRPFVHGLAVSIVVIILAGVGALVV